MWKRINREEIHNYSVGDKVRIDGVEDVITYIYARGDDGFNTQDSGWARGSYVDVFATGDWEQHQVEIWDEQSEQGDDSVDNFKLEKGMYFSVEGMTQEDFDKIIGVARKQGINLFGCEDTVCEFHPQVTHFIIDYDGDLTDNHNLSGSIDACVGTLAKHGLITEEISYQDILGTNEAVDVGGEDDEIISEHHKQLLETIKVVGNAVQRISGTKRNEGDAVLVALINKAAEKFL